MEISFLEFIFILVIFLANIIQTVTGFAGTVIAMPASIRFVGYDIAKPILNFIAIFVCLVVVIVNFKNINWRKFLFLILFVGIGFGSGFIINKGIQKYDLSDIIFKIYGIIICLIAIVFFFFKFDDKKLPVWLECIVLIIAGILHFLYTSGGPLVVIFAVSSLKDKHEFRGTLSMMWVILNSIGFVSDIASNKFVDPHIWFLMVVVIVISVLSIAFGKLIVNKLNQKVFMKITYLLLFISGLMALI